MPVAAQPVVAAPVAQPAVAAPALTTRSRPGRGKWLAVLGAVLLVGVGAAAIVALDPFGGPVAPADLGPPSVVVNSAPAGLEIFDHGRFRGETPIEYSLEEDKAEHRLQIATATGTYKTTMAAQRGPGWLYVVLPAKGKQIGHAVVVTTPPGAGVTVDGADAGKTPLTLVGAPGRRFALEVTPEGGDARPAEATPTPEGSRVEVAIE